ncbi:MAG: HlyD family secretion protein [Marinicellaceae bacterium]
MKIIILLTLTTFMCSAETIFITGELESKNTQRILMPLVPSFNGKISEMEQEGKRVKKGDILVRIDGANINTQLESQIDDMENFLATAKRSEIEYDIQLNTTEMNYKSSKINLEIAQMQAQIPEDFIGELQYKQNQLQLKNREKSYKKAITDLSEIKTVIENSKKKVSVGVIQKQNKLDYLKSTLENFTVTAEQEGYIIYATHSWTGEKIQEGDQIQTGMNIMNVSQNTDLQIVASVNAIDIPKLVVGQPAQITFDAYLDKTYQGKIIKISSGGSDKQIWGDGLYYQATIQIEDSPSDDLLLGMSALVTIDL